ncbi:MAG: hypothetical protein IT450_24275 [Phycisphaerales bacterium]|nr:hypothetical protein [Phycisphaerales bacterium]
MANGPQITSGSGLRRIQAYLLDSSGLPSGDESGADGYDGVNVEGARSFSMPVPDVRLIQHIGNDRLLAQDYLPPTEGVRGEITTAKQNLGLDAAITDTLVEQVGETTVSGMITDKQGHEKDLCLVVYRQALDTTAGSSQVRRWQMHMIPVGRMIPRGSTAEQDAADENRYTVVPGVATQYPWGHAFTLTDEGFTEAQYLRFTSENPAMLEKWTGNGTLTVFNTTWTPISVAKTHAEADGAEITVSSVDTANNTLTLAEAPDGDFFAWYETSDGIG